jgi:hypothetical protein
MLGCALKRTIDSRMSCPIGRPTIDIIATLQASQPFVPIQSRFNFSH